jgi:hypothetical protein
MIKNQEILSQTVVVQEKGNIVSDMDGEKVMLSIHNGKYYNLGQIGGVIWDKIEGPTYLTHLVNSLMSEYDVNQNECEEQVISFLEVLAKEGLVKIEKEDM